MTYRFDVYIRSDDGSGKIGHEYLDKIIGWAETNFPKGYTLQTEHGCYDSTEEIHLC
jgi:hypothetical protein